MGGFRLAPRILELAHRPSDRLFHWHEDEQGNGQQHEDHQAKRDPALELQPVEAFLPHRFNGVGGVAGLRQEGFDEIMLMPRRTVFMRFDGLGLILQEGRRSLDERFEKIAPVQCRVKALASGGRQ